MTIGKVNWIAIITGVLPVSLLWCLNVLFNVDIFAHDDTVAAVFVVATVLAAVAVLALALAFAATAAFAAAATAAFAAAAAAAFAAAFAAAAVAAAVAAFVAAAAATERKELSFWLVFSRLFLATLASGLGVYIILSQLTLFSFPLWATSFLPALAVSVLVRVLPSGKKEPHTENA